MPKKEKAAEWSFEEATKTVRSCLKDARAEVDARRRLQAISAITLVEHHIDVAERLTKGLHHEEKVRKYRKQVKDLRRRVGIVGRILGRILGL